MNPSIRLAAALGIAGLIAATVAAASPPDPYCCTLINKDIASVGKNAYIAVVGQNAAGLPDPCEPGGRCGDYEVTVDDIFTHAPIEGAFVIIDFSNCPDIQISCDQLEAATGQTVLAGKKVAGSTDADGRFRFYVQGASNSTSTFTPGFLSPGTNAGVPCAQIYADGIPSGNVAVSAYDVNGLGSPFGAAVNAADVAIVKIEALINALGNKARSDYNYDNAVNAGDVGISQSIALTNPANGTVKTTPFADGHYCP